jgi:molecular chaperone GrpE (heat shock protein)
MSPPAQQTTPPDYTADLKFLMVAVGLDSFQALYHRGISKQQVQRIRRGEIQHLRLSTLLGLSQILQISLEQLVQTFASQPNVQTESTQYQTLQQEYQRLQVQLQEQRLAIEQEFQQQSLQMLESFLLQWPTAAYAARNNPTAPAVKLLPLARPIEQLLQSWGITPIGEVGQAVLYDPQWHQGLAGEAIPPGTSVQIRHVGYRQGERLLYRAKVSTPP